MTSHNHSAIAAERWHRFAAATVRSFHRYGTWLVSLSWWRFGWYSLLLLIATAIVQKLPPFSWTYTETVVDSGHRSTHQHAHAPPPSATASAALAAPPASGNATATAATQAATPATPAEPAPPLIHIKKSPTAPGGDSKSVDINLPGIVIDSKDSKSLHKGGVNIVFGNNGIHITTDDEPADKPKVNAGAEAASAARAAAAAALAKAAGVAASAPSTPSTPDTAVDIVAGGQHIRIGVPAHADSEEVRDAVAEAREAIVESLKDAEQARKDAAEEAADAAREAADAARDKASSHDSDDDDDVQIDDGGNHSTLRTHTVHYGETLPLLAIWWVLGSLLLKITYKGRIQAEVKAAVATETAEAESLRRQVLEARMAMMQAQVEPHFLFNTLASIDHLIEFDPKRASQMQRNLISLLRASMPTMRAATDSGLRPLDLELAVVRPYLEILKVRMEERLTTDIDIPEGLLSAEFPPMMIQTLVENAIKHGLEPKAEGGHLGVKAEIRHGKLCVTVIDTGLGFAGAAGGETSGTGVGLANIRERLSLLYGTKAALTIANNPVGGTIVTITVPYTTHTDAGASA